jgi:DNA-binding transcriptional LysR family regulator
MDFKRLEYFCTLVEHGSFSNAAKSLHISQPPLSQRVKELEEELGVELIHRTSRTFQVTPKGEELYHRAQFILSYIHSFEKDFLDKNSPISGHVRIGVCPPCQSIIRSSMAELQKKFPRITFRLWLMDNQSLERHMQEVHLDLCIAQLPLRNQNYKMVRLRSSGFCAVFGKDIPAPAKKTVDARDLCNVPLILSRRRDGGGSYEYIMREFQREGIMPDVLLDTQDNRIMVELLQYGMKGVALLPESEIPAKMDLEVRKLNFSGLKTFPVILALRQAYLSHAALGVLRFLYEKFRDPDDKKDYMTLLFEQE